MYEGNTMWIRLALLLLCCLTEQTTASTSVSSSGVTAPSSADISTTPSSSTNTSTPSSSTDTSTPSSSTNTSTPSSSTNTSTPSSSTNTSTPSSSTNTSTPSSSTDTSTTPSSKDAITMPSSIIISNNASIPTTSATSPTTETNSTSTPITTNSSSIPTTSATTTGPTTDTNSTSTPITTNSSSIPTTSATTSNNLKVILPAAIVPIVVCSIVALLVFFYLKRSKQKITKDPVKKVTRPIDILEFDSDLRDMNANSQLKFSEEFTALVPVGKEYSKDVAGQEANREKNRYTDIKPYDISRVKLSINPEDESDYINASWIPGYFSRRQYIAAQGPMPSTQDDFWRMVWEYNSRIIVMLTRTVENNRMKCCQYWPADKEVVMYGDIAVSIIDETETDSWITREMNVSMGQQKRLVKQCFFTKWPDMKTPEDSSSIINFIRMVRSYCPIRGSSPLVVHCSAGVGRTGAFIALDTAMYQIEEEEKVDVFGIVYKMRLNRVSMVQNERQYIFIYETVADMIRNYQEEKKKKPNGQADFFIGELPKTETISDNVVYQNIDANNVIYKNIDASNSALVINEDIRNLL